MALPAAVGRGRARGSVRGAHGVVARRTEEEGGPGEVGIIERGGVLWACTGGVGADRDMVGRRGRGLVRGVRGTKMVGDGMVVTSGVRHIYWTRSSKLEVRGGRDGMVGWQMPRHGHAIAGKVQ